jgi:hypothetical protein
MLAELIDAAIIIFVLKRFVLTFAVVTPPAGENPPDKFNEVNVAVPAFTLFVEILPVLQIFTEVRMLPKSSFPTYKFPIKALPAPIVVVLIVPALNVLVEIFPVFEILPVLVVPSVVVPATPRVPVLEVFVKEPVAAKSVFVEILPVLLIRMQNLPHEILLNIVYQVTLVKQLVQSMDSFSQLQPRYQQVNCLPGKLELFLMDKAANHGLSKLQ